MSTIFAFRKPKNKIMKGSTGHFSFERRLKHSIVYFHFRSTAA